jgi:hypothetical protein
MTDSRRYRRTLSDGLSRAAAPSYLLNIGFSHEDMEARRIDVEDADLAERLRDRSLPEPRYPTGVFARYAAQVASASDGAVTRP